MDVVARYLKTVRSGLAGPQRDDIIRELSENLRSQVEDQENELGRPLSEAEVEAILKAHGHPLIVAGKYRQEQRSFTFGKQLVGPVLFPFYAKVLSFNLGITSIVILFIFTALVISGQPVKVLSGIPSVLFYQLVMQFAIVTVIFIVADRHLAKTGDDWDPRKPERAYTPQFAETKDPQRVSRIESLSRLIGLAVVLMWLRALQSSPFLMLGPAAAFLKLAPVWHQLYLPAVLLVFAEMAQAGINLVRPDWVQLRSVTRIATSVATLALWCFLLKAGTWIVPGNSATNFAVDHLHELQIINKCFFYGLLIAVALSAKDLVLNLYRWFRGTRQRMPSPVL